MSENLTFLSKLRFETAQKGSLLSRGSAASNSAIFIEQGLVALSVADPGEFSQKMGRQLGVVEGPNWLDASATVLNIASGIDATALTNVKYRRFPIGELRGAIDACAPVVQSLLIGLARANSEQTDLAVIRQAKEAEARCAEWLLSRAEVNASGDSVVHLKLFKSAIAMKLGIVPETLSRIFARMRALQLISGTGRILILKDPIGLRRLAGLRDP